MEDAKLKELVDKIEVSSLTSEIIADGDKDEVTLALAILGRIIRKELAKGWEKADHGLTLQVHKDLCALRDHLGLPDILL